MSAWWNSKSHEFKAAVLTIGVLLAIAAFLGYFIFIPFWLQMIILCSAAFVLIVTCIYIGFLHNYQDEERNRIANEEYLKRVARNYDQPVE